MKNLILVLCLMISIETFGATESTRIRGKVIGFDLKTVTIEIAGKNHIFSREKLGKEFKALKKGEYIEIDTGIETKDEPK